MYESFQIIPVFVFSIAFGLQIFISEFLTSGAFDGQVSPSLAAEGQAMVLSLIEDASRIDAVQVCTTWDTGMGDFPIPDVDVTYVDGPIEEGAAFDRLASSSDCVLVIAPETERLLLKRFDRVAGVAGKWNGASRDAILTCADKLEMSRVLSSAGVPTIPTFRLDDTAALRTGRRVVKPIDGAGSESTFIVNHGDRISDLDLQRPRHRYVMQPMIPGTPVSVFCVVERKNVHVFPTAEQHVSLTDTIQYCGGVVPVAVCLKALAVETVNAISARCGHFGIDVILPDDGSGPMVVEVNPRLTTSYLGYREVLSDNVAERILFPERFTTAVPTSPGRVVRFDAGGRVGEHQSMERQL